MPAGGSAVSGAASGSLADLAAWLRGLDGAAAWHPASYYAGGGEDPSAVAWSDVTGSGKPADNATKNTIFRQTSAPTSGMTTNDIWFDTSTLNPKVYSYNGSAWVLAGDITGNNTAAAISGQGALATVNQINSGNFSTLLGGGIIDRDRLIPGNIAKLTRYFTATAWAPSGSTMNELEISGFTCANAYLRQITLKISFLIETTTDGTRYFGIANDLMSDTLPLAQQVAYDSTIDMGSRFISGTVMISGGILKLGTGGMSFSIYLYWKYSGSITKQMSNILLYVEEITA
ncbi:hypothetical protein ACQE3D_18495 [Methylomonas sp. MS20]|uniref:hypothetical protein n=1 Tax=Methylomonas sp. MS20 TaxID=3418769 RepID=UPI003D004DB5